MLHDYVARKISTIVGEIGDNTATLLELLIIDMRKKENRRESKREHLYLIQE